MYPPDYIEQARVLQDLSRFELALDGKDIVAVVGAFTLKVTVPGGAQLPMGGLTWVSTAATHRRQGLLTKLMARSLDDVDRRGEPIAMLGASEGGIYERYGFGIASHMRSTTIDRRTAQLRPEFTDPSRAPCGSSMATRRWLTSSDVWTRFHRTRSGELGRSEAWHRFVFEIRASGARWLQPFLLHRPS